MRDGLGIVLFIAFAAGAAAGLGLGFQFVEWMTPERGIMPYDRYPVFGMDILHNKGVFSALCGLAAGVVALIATWIKVEGFAR